MIDLTPLEIWFITGSQHLYGAEVLKIVFANAQEIANGLDASAVIPVSILAKPIVTEASSASRIFEEASVNPRCIGVITWCHTFSPSKMWINALKLLRRPLLHLHTQHNRDLPWSTIDMDFMNLNQAAHGDREHGFIMSRMRLNRKVVVGHWTDPRVHGQIAAWSRAAAAWRDWQDARFCRFGDNMRDVAVTEGDKVAAQIQFGYSVNGYGIGDLVESIRNTTEREIDELVAEYDARYTVAPKLRKGAGMRPSLPQAAQIELGLRSFLSAGKFKGFTDTFEDLHGLAQLPGLAVQRLMADGYGFGAEGDWKTAALVRAMKVMASGLKGGTSFMEDYTYDLNPDGTKVLGAHMLEICPSLSNSKPAAAIHPLGIGGKADPVRLIFDTPPGPAVNASIVDLGNRFRLLVNEVDVVAAPAPLAKLPVARAVWKCRPDFETAIQAWIYGGGAHHTGFSQAVTTEMLEDFAEMAGIEACVIDSCTKVRDFRRDLRFNEVYFSSCRGL